MKENPCHNCPYRKPTCHDFCKEYLEWHQEQVAMKKAAAFDKLMNNIVAGLTLWETRYKTPYEKRSKK